jgi:TetR/AcrR family transcriptional repressor of nem operon
MGRPREFDEATVLDAAMRRFWAQGYEATSVRNLATDMGITGASLYNAFGDKRTLYRQALDFYFEQSVRDRVRRLEGSLPSFAAIRAFFDEVIERSVTDAQCRGCLLVNSALEVSAEDTDLRAAVAAEMVLIEGFFRRCVASGQADGSITAHPPPDALAKLLLSLLLGLRVLARTRPQREVLEGAAGGAFALLQSPTIQGAMP